MAMQQNMGKRDLEESAVWGARAVLGEIRRREHLEIALRDTMEGLNRISAQGASLRLQFAAQVIDEWGYNCLSGCVPWVMNQVLPSEPIAKWQAGSGALGVEQIESAL